MNRAKGLLEYYDNLKILAEWEASKPEKVKKAKTAVDKWKKKQKEKDLLIWKSQMRERKLIVV